MTAHDDDPAARDAARFRWTAGAVALASAAGAIAYLIAKGAHPGSLAAAALAVFLSKLFIFGGAIELWPFDATTLDFSAWELALIAWILDLWVACGLLAGIAGVERMPLVGRALREARARASQTLIDYPGLRRLAVFGIALLVFLPIPASGAVTGSLVGRLVGLTRMNTLAAVGGGAGVAVSVYAGVATFLDANWRELIGSPALMIASVIGLAAFAWIAWMRVRRELTRA